MELIRRYFLIGLVASLLLGAVFAFLGVYNTSSLPFYKRYVFWTATMLVGNFTTGLAAPWVMHKAMVQQHRSIQLTTITALISIPVTFVLAAFEWNVDRQWTINTWIIRYIYVAVISAILVFCGYFILKAQGLFDIPCEVNAKNEDQATHSSQAGLTKILQRLPDKFKQAELYAISSEDHYLRVHTSIGETLILMRLSDALLELEHVDGMQTHRSWWVASSAVVNCERKSGKHRLILKSGAQVPVSRSFDKAVTKAQFI